MSILPLMLGRRGLTGMQERLRSIADAHGLRSPFNPSLALVDDVWHIAFRANRAEAGSPIGGYVARLDGTGSLLDLGSRAAELGIEKVADPKLVVLDGVLHVTFNTGYVAGKPNAVYLQRIGGVPGDPQRCELPGRQRIEKNWAFYLDGDGLLRALYSLEPVRSLRLVDGRIGGDGPLTFAFSLEATAPAPHAFTIGTQLSSVGAGETAVLIAHRKVFLRRRRAYSGVAVELDLRSAEPRIIRRGRPLLHSLGSLRRVRQPRNPNLYSATYCSGLQVVDGTAVIGYGVNDTGSGIAGVPYGTLW